MSQNIPEILYQNAGYQSDATITTDPDQTVPNDGAAINAFDWFDWSTYTPSSDEAEVWVAVSRSVQWELTRAAVYQVATTAPRLYIIDQETGVGTDTWNKIGEIDTAAGTTLQVETIVATIPADVRVRFRWVVGTDSNIRQFYLGDVMTPEIGQFQGMKPPTLVDDVVTTNTIAVNGSFLGRDQRRTDRGQELSFQPVSPEWVRDTWEPFVNEAIVHAFIFRWSPKFYPTENAWAVGTGTTAPLQISPSPKLQVTMPIRTLI